MKINLDNYINVLPLHSKLNIMNKLINILLAFAILLLLVTISSCSTSRVPNIHKPTKREINKAMKLSDGEYKQPRMKLYSTYPNY
jgi:hypothetical protein